jgi:biotin carboxylase
LPGESQEVVSLRQLNRDLINALGLMRGVSHAEFIGARSDGHFYFLECAARVGGAYISEMVETATGINLWREWARIEIAGGKQPYHLPATRSDYAGIILSLARQEEPDTSAYSDPEIALRLKKRHHAGLVLRSSDPERVQTLLQAYVTRFANDFLAIEPPGTKPAA